MYIVNYIFNTFPLHTQYISIQCLKKNAATKVKFRTAVTLKLRRIRSQLETKSNILQDHSNDAILEAQRKRQAELIHQLKGQLQELESYAYESGDGNMPSNILLERQRVVMGNAVFLFCILEKFLMQKVATGIHQL